MKYFLLVVLCVSANICVAGIFQNGVVYGLANAVYNKDASFVEQDLEQAFVDGVWHNDFVFAKQVISQDYNIPTSDVYDWKEVSDLNAVAFFDGLNIAVADVFVSAINYHLGEQELVVLIKYIDSDKSTKQAKLKFKTDLKPVGSRVLTEVKRTSSNGVLSCWNSGYKSCDIVLDALKDDNALSYVYNQHCSDERKSVWTNYNSWFLTDELNQRFFSKVNYEFLFTKGKKTTKVSFDHWYFTLTEENEITDFIVRGWVGDVVMGNYFSLKCNE